MYWRSPIFSILKAAVNHTKKNDEWLVNSAFCLDPPSSFVIVIRGGVCKDKVVCDYIVEHVT